MDFYTFYTTSMKQLLNARLVSPATRSNKLTNVFTHDVMKHLRASLIASWFTAMMEAKLAARDK